MTEEIPVEKIESEQAKFDGDGKEVNWEQADILSSRFIKFDTDTEKVLVISNWNLVQKKDRFDEAAPPKIYFVANVIEEDGEPVEKILESPSMRLRTKLRPILEKKDKNTQMKLSITRVGDKFETQYLVKEV